MARLFVAIWPSPSVAAALHALDVAPEPGVRPVPPSNWHITLRFLGDGNPDEVAERLTEVALPAATVSLGPTVERLGRNQLVIPTTGADDLATTVAAATVDLGEPVRRRFVGHLTVARTKRGAHSRVVGRAFTASQVVTEVAIVESELTPQGAVYTTWATFMTRP